MARRPLGLEPLPRQPCGIRRQKVTVREHERDALLPGREEVRRDNEPRSCRLCWCGPRVYRESPDDPRLVDIFVPAIGGYRPQHHLLAPQRRLPRQYAPGRHR